MSDLSAIVQSAANAGLGPADLKAKVPVSFVLEHYGIHTEVGSDGKVHCRCPFHDDSDPSFDVFGEHLERWGCYPCGKGGDVFDLVEALDPEVRGFADAARVVEGLVDDAAKWEGPRQAVPRVFDAKAAADRVAAAYAAAQDTTFLDEFVSTKGFEFDSTWLRDQWGVGSEGALVVMPYWDREKALIGYKRRTASTKPIAAGGATFSDFYGAWRDTGKRPVIITEGESDTWTAAYYCPDHDALGLPTGAGTKPVHLADRLAGRDVILAFDGDVAGRKATFRWHTALVAKGATVRIVPMPDGLDLSSLVDVPAAVASARAVPSYPEEALFEIGTSYARKSGKEGHTQVSNWTFTPQRELTDEDGTTAYEGTVQPAGVAAVLSSGDLSSKARIIGWSNRFGGSWFGTDRDAQVLLAMLQSLGPFLATGRMTQVAGYHHGHFVWPGGKLGPDHWQYVTPPTDVELEKDLHLVPAAWDIVQVEVLRSLHSRAVMDPILAWLAAAPARSMLGQFPFLGVTGSAGTGKSTLVRETMRAFSGSAVGANLTATTRFAVSAMVEATNGIPVWFDEYRPAARSDTLEAIRQFLRDAFDGARSARGGTKDHWAKVARRAATAPIIVSGEDAFEETSLVQRMISVALPLDGRNPDSLARVKSWGDSGLPYAYLSWLIDSLQSGRLWRFENYEAGPDTLPTRNRIGLGVLDLGWKLLTRFVDEHGGRDIGEPDLSLIIGEAAESATHSPIEDALRWIIDEQDAQGSIIGRRGSVDLWLRVQNFVAFATKAGFLLPGGTSAVKKYLIQHYGAHDTTVETYGTQKRALLIPQGSTRILGA